MYSVLYENVIHLASIIFLKFFLEQLILYQSLWPQLNVHAKLNPSRGFTLYSKPSVLTVYEVCWGRVQIYCFITRSFLNAAIVIDV